MNANDVLLIGGAIGAALAALLAPLMRKPAPAQTAPPSMSVVGGAMADTFAMQQSAEATTRLALATDRLAVAQEAANEGAEDQGRKVVAIMDKMLDEFREIRRAAESASRRR